MSVYVIIKNMADGNETVGEMWNETKVYEGSSTLDEVMKWANPKIVGTRKPSHKNIMITKPDES